MKSLIMIIIAGALINNVVLNQFLGICSFLGVSKQMKASISLGGAVIFVIPLPPPWPACCMTMCCSRWAWTS